MKFVKLSVLTLTLGLFVASCGNGGAAADADKKAADSAAAATAAAAPVAAPAAAPAADTTKKMDTAKTAAPSAPTAEKKK